MSLIPCIALGYLAPWHCFLASLSGVACFSVVVSMIYAFDLKISVKILDNNSKIILLSPKIKNVRMDLLFEIRILYSNVQDHYPNAWIIILMIEF